MNNLIIKEVSFNGAQLMAAQDGATGKIYAGVSYVCNGIGLSEGQRDRQVKNIQSDIVLKQGAKKLSVKFDGQVREVLCVDLEFLPLWLAKIEITPKMQEEQPELTQRLVNYQLKAKDVLAAAFLPKPKHQSKTNLSSVNNAVKIIGQYMTQAGIGKDIQLLAVKGLYAKADVHLPIDIEADKVYYDTKQIAKQFGMYTKTGKPAYHAVSQIVKKFDIFTDEVKEVWETNGSWQGVAKKYSDTVIGKIEEWLRENNYPSTITDGNKNYHVFYEIKAAL